MTDKEKIRDEIIKRLASCPEHHNAYDEEQENAYREILYFIDSMPVEPKFKVGDIVRSNNGTILKIIGVGQYCYHCDNDYSFGFNIQDEFELVEETVSEDMEKAAKVYEQTRNDLDVVSDNQMVERAFLAGAKWQRQQLMKKAIEGIVTTNIEGWINVMTGFIRPEEAGANFGNKVKLIIIKED